ncbi:hypothetical protein M406DRAFT_323622 [Cryphonectria parasitica EP155]|uniref:Uncharacterized protein n=1 Tax=Cryphonectria parasitica (strain ATCC 38755 / EP155) TaxID=660469 RepID=A0A9P5CKT3_CRYP1|nr:uncharacterized protein M406DRAFT_323622 [Cryphonectria parasitica EP155]KAF3762589.1 hypothetical protein M406DRAFT_323622 [Cryphonectria parasitica EP155]
MCFGDGKKKKQYYYREEIYPSRPAPHHQYYQHTARVSRTSHHSSHSPRGSVYSSRGGPTVYEKRTTKKYYN